MLVDDFEIVGIKCTDRATFAFVLCFFVLIGSDHAGFAGQLLWKIGVLSSEAVFTVEGEHRCKKQKTTKKRTEGGMEKKN
jgi:hypothetical protein